MNAERHERIYSIFREACELRGDDRGLFIRRACADDDSLRIEIEQLLAQDDERASFLQTPVLASSISDHAAEPAPIRLPAQIASYRIISQLGTGGMGVVYLAEQASPKRTVALKVLRPGFVNSQMLRRFEQESQLLGRLTHPSIARVYEAGTADAGLGPQPYFAMEFVSGLSLIEHAEKYKLDLRARLELLVLICDAVHHAHIHGVIHRDLKPGNILVVDESAYVDTGSDKSTKSSWYGHAGNSSRESSSIPKILDFGVARMIDAEAQQVTLHTSAGELVGTLQYMSPEQAAGDHDRIDIRSDIYSLGVVACELLTGRPPYAIERRRLDEAVRTITQSPPAPLRSIDASLPGDVETVVLKALEKEPERRYQSAAALGEDIRRAINDQPILARPASALYQLRKFARRNRLLVSSAAAIAILLVGGILVSTVMALALAAQRDQAKKLQEAAEREAAVARAVGAYLRDVFAAASPYTGRHDITVADALDLAASRVDERLGDMPGVAGAVHLYLSETYYGFGNLDKALRQAQQAVVDYESDPTIDPVLLAGAYGVVGQVHMEQGRLDDAETWLTRAMPIMEEHAGEDDESRIDIALNYSVLLYQRKRHADAEPLMRQVLVQRQKKYGSNDPRTLMALNNLANNTWKLGRLDEAAPLLRDIMERSRASLGDQHPNTLTSIYNYADVLREQGQFDQSASLYLDATDLGQKHLPPGHWLVALYRNGYGELLRQTRRFDEAQKQLVESHDVLHAQLGVGHSHTQRAVRRLVALYNDWGRPEEAATWRALMPAEPLSAK